MSIQSARAARAARSRSAPAQEVPWPLPVKGLLSEASTSEINGSMAEVLHNWTSDGLSLECRDGYTLIEDGTPIQRIPFEFAAGIDYIKVYDNKITFGVIEYAGSFSADISHTSLSSNVIMADGIHGIARADGTQIIDAGYTTDTGKLSSEFDGVFSHHDRVYAWDSDELAFYYGAVGAVTGELTRFPLDRLGNITGTITIISSMTVNAAHGMNDILVIVTSTGWVVLYEGLDPGDVLDWRLLGRIKTSAPLSKFAINMFGSDLWVLTVRGIVSIRYSLQNGALSLIAPEAAAISDLLIADIKIGKELRGWQMITRPDESQVLLNVPTTTGVKQYVYEAEGRSWQTADYPARWFHELNGILDFTSESGNLNRINSDSDAGNDITATFYTSWIRLPRHTELAYLIPTIIADNELFVKITVLTDHNATPDDIAQAEQIVLIKPDNSGARVSLDDIIGVNAAGRVFQARFEITGRNFSFENLIAGLA